jgi:hypothetical protein
MAPPGNAIVLAMNASKHVSPIVHRPFMHLRWGARYAFALGHPLNLSSRITVAGHRDLVTREEFVVFPSHGLSESVVRIFGTRGGFKPQGVSKFRHRTGNIRRPSAASEMNPLAHHQHCSRDGNVILAGEAVPGFLGLAQPARTKNALRTLLVNAKPHCTTGCNCARARESSLPHVRRR